ncbi:MAG TPA: hypothetical protein DIC32_03690 [Acinetobacter radioresistens]|uniref:DUF2570 domain-containing protein n=1 Tax=Acinetobacter radioresistens TaxID=40216 RepID=A0A3D3FZR9_ACIRA|nr:hypothetical protein [Acinetobacter radioresistens]
MIKAFIAKFYETVIIFLAVFLLVALIWGGYYKYQFNTVEPKFQLELAQEKQKHIDDLKEIQRIQIEALSDIQISINAAGINYETMRIEHEKVTEALNRKLQTVIADTLYQSICFNAGGVQLANEAKNGSGSAKPP